MPDRADALQRLPTAVRARLEAFASALEALTTEQIMLFGARPLDTPTHERARAAADERIQWHRWQEPMAVMRHELLQWLVTRYTRRIALTDVYQFHAVSDGFRVVDELRIGQSLADALRAIAVWDEIDEGYRDELLGPWSALVPGGSSIQPLAAADDG